MEGAPVRVARPRADAARRLARGRDSRGHPFAPAEFPRPPSTAGTLRPLGPCALRYRGPRRRMPTAIHARRRLLAAACPQMSRMNVGHRPAIHIPHRHPSRAAGFRGPRRPCGLRGLSTPRKPGPEGRPVEGSLRLGSLSGGGHRAPRRVRYWNGCAAIRGRAHAGLPTQSLVPTAGRTNGRAALMRRPTRQAYPRSHPGSHHPGLVSGAPAGSKVWRAGSPRRATLSECQPL